MRGSDLSYRLEVEFLDAVNGASRQVKLADGNLLDIAIPAGTRDGQTLRLRGKGEPGLGGGEPGDALIEIVVRLHKVFKRDGDNIRLELPISVREAIIGGKVTVPTPTGPVIATVPKWSSSGRVLRLKSKGIRKRGGQAGDLYVTLSIVLPAQPDADLERAITGWAGGEADNPRGRMDL